MLQKGILDCKQVYFIMVSLYNGCMLLKIDIKSRYSHRLKPVDVIQSKLMGDMVHYPLLYGGTFFYLWWLGFT